MKKLSVPVALFVVAFVSLVWLAPAVAAHASSAICVNRHNKNCYSTIQAAVNAAPSGATIVVTTGIYHEQVTVSGKYLDIQGQGVIVDASGQQHGFYVDGAGAAGTVISDFTVRHAQFEGILIQDTSSVTVKNSVVELNDTNFDPSTGSCPGEPFPAEQGDCGEGLHLLGVSNSKIEFDTIRHNVGGILLSDDTGPNFNNTIAYNDSEQNAYDCGITLASHNPMSPNGVYKNVILKNTSIHNGAAGIGMFAPIPGTATYDNLVSHNTVEDNGLGGIDIHSHANGQDVNGNSIIGNTLSGNAPDFGTGDTAPVGIVIFADVSGKADPIMGTTISLNTVTNESVDVYVGTNQTNLALHLNNLLGGNGTIGVENNGTGKVDADKNYWGCQQGPGMSNCTTIVGNVSFTPWLKNRAN